MLPSILLVDDSSAARNEMRRVLEQSDLDLVIVEAKDGAEALRIALSGDIDIVVADVHMPHTDGIALLRAIRAQHSPEALPVILVTANDSNEQRAGVFQSGANDYLNRPFVPAELIGRVHVQLRLRRLQQELQQTQKEFHHLGTHDQLTGLANRSHFLHLTRKELARTQRHGFDLSIAIMDVDHFRSINTHAGHLGGDAIITELGHLMVAQLRSPDIVARFSGGKFAALLPQTDCIQAQEVFHRLRNTVRIHALPHYPKGGISLCIGLAGYPMGQLESVDEMINAAEAALDRAKQLGDDRLELWDA